MKTQKELNSIYKDMKFRIGVFQIRNTITNKIFVGSSTDLDATWNRYKFELNMGSHPNQKLQQDWSDLGEANFSYEVLMEIKQDDTKIVDYRKEAKKLEKMFIEELQPFDDKGYNTKSKIA